MESVGLDRATQIADLLERGLVVCYRHRDYCGMGMRYAENLYIYDEAHDSLIPTEQEFLSWALKQNQRRVFDSKASFISWLALQTDKSLSGAEQSDIWLYRNQRLTIARLDKAIQFCCTKPERKWNEFAD